MPDQPQDLPARRQLAQDTTASEIVPPEGGTVGFADSINVVFPTGVFDSPQRVIVTTSRAPALRDFFNLTASFYSATAAKDYTIIINTGSSVPAGRVWVGLQFPANSRDSESEVQDVMFFAREISGGPNETHDYMRPIDSEFEVVSRVLGAWLDPDHFYEGLSAPKVFEAMITAALVDESQ